MPSPLPSRVSHAGWRLVSPPSVTSSLPASQCLVELNAALDGRKPVMMLIGAAGTDGRFVPEKGMGDNLIFSIDVQQAEASVPADLERELKKIKASEGGCGAIDRLAIGSISGAIYAMDQRAVLAAVAGDMAPLAALQGAKELGEAMRGAAAAGFLEPLRALLSRTCPWRAPIVTGALPCCSRARVVTISAPGQ